MPLYPNFQNQKELFKWIWDHRPHYSEVSGKFLGNQPNVFFFAHILPKSLSTRFRLRTINIALMTAEEHMFYDQSGKAGTINEFNWVFRLRFHLKKLDNVKGGWA